VDGALQVVTSDGERVRLVEGDTLLLAPGASCVTRPLTTPCEVHLLEADAAWTAAMLQLSSGPSDREQSGVVSVLRASSTASRRVRQILRELALPWPLDEESSGLRRTHGVLELLALAAEAGDADHPPAHPSHAGAASRSAFLAAVAALDGAEELEELSLGAFSERLGLSERQVSRLFRVELDTTFCAFLRRLRVDRARRLLETSTLSVVQVAAETGWRSLAHFNAVFRQLTGCTPTAYRASALAVNRMDRAAP
jgi:AraC-like DNA-binding protein